MPGRGAEGDGEEGVFEEGVVGVRDREGSRGCGMWHLRIFEAGKLQKSHGGLLAAQSRASDSALREVSRGWRHQHRQYKKCISMRLFTSCDSEYSPLAPTQAQNGPRDFCPPLLLLSFTNNITINTITINILVCL